MYLKKLKLKWNLYSKKLILMYLAGSSAMKT